MLEVSSITEEALDTTTLRFDMAEVARPGQFVMVWVPGVDEIPMSLSYMGDVKGVTVKAVGEATRALAAVSVGELVGVRGPYGNGFDLPEGRVLVVGGGVGMAAVMPAAESLGTKADMVIGARSAKDVTFLSRAEAACSRVEVSTDDGSMGFHGNAVQLSGELMDEGRYDAVLACGPEVMLYFLLNLCRERGVPCQLSLERYMKCGAGLCGSCVINGRRVCAEGPVFHGDELVTMNEFGRYRRDPSGRRMPI